MSHGSGKDLWRPVVFVSFGHSLMIDELEECTRFKQYKLAYDHVTRRYPLDHPAISYLQQHLLTKYRRDFLPIFQSPLLDIVSIDINKVYTELLIEEIKQAGGKSNHRCRNKVQNVSELLYSCSEAHKQIFVVGKSGSGKTTWVRNLVSKWCDAISKQNSDTQDENILKYCLVFYVELRHAEKDSSIMDMIKHQLFEERPDLMTDVKRVLSGGDNEPVSLVILDGLDEWRGQSHCSNSESFLPIQESWWKSPIIVTMTNWKLEQMQLDPKKIPRVVEIKGLERGNTETFVKKFVAEMNALRGERKKPNLFKSWLHPCMQQFMHNPLLLTTLVCLWYENLCSEECLAGSFIGLIELLIKHTEENRRIEPSKILTTMKSAWRKERIQIPDFIITRERIVSYAPFLLRLGKIAMDSLLSINEKCAFLNYQSITNVISEDELRLAINIGLLSAQAPISMTRQTGSCISFCHKLIQEFLAALFMVSEGRQSRPGDEYIKNCSNASKVLYMEHVFLFVTELKPAVARMMAQHIATLEPNESIYKLLVRYLHQECASSLPSSNIKIRHFFLYPSDKTHSDGVDYNIIGMSLLKEAERPTVRFTGSRGDNILNSVMKCTHIVETILDFSECPYFERFQFNLAKIVGQERFEQVSTIDFKVDSVHRGEMMRALRCVRWKTPGTILIKYKVQRGGVLDISQCNHIGNITYRECATSMEHTLQSLKECDGHGNQSMIKNGTEILCWHWIEDFAFRHCKSCITLRNNAEQMFMCGYDVKIPSRCESCIIQNREAMKMHFDSNEDLFLPRPKSCEPVQIRFPTNQIYVPSECLEVVSITGYKAENPLTKHRLTCKTHVAEQKQDRDAFLTSPSSDKKRVAGNPENKFIGKNSIDLSHCASLKFVRYTRSTAQILVPTGSLEGIEIKEYSPNEDCVLDLSKCSSLKCIRYMQSTAPVKFPTENLVYVEINDFNSNDREPLDFSNCKSLRTMLYKNSTPTIKLPAESLQEVRFVNYKQEEDSFTLDLSRCKALRTVQYTLQPKDTQSTACNDPSDECCELTVQFSPIETSTASTGKETSPRPVRFWLPTVLVRVPPDRIQDVQIQNYKSRKLLNLSECKQLKCVSYKQSTASIRFPSEAMESVEIFDFRPVNEKVLNLSACSSLKTVRLKQTTARLLLPTEKLQTVKVSEYEPDVKTDLDLSECKHLKTLCYEQATERIRLPMERLETVIISGYTPSEELTLDLRMCKCLKTVRYKHSAVVIQLPSNSLEDLEIVDYHPTEMSVLDLSGCSSLSTFRYKQSTSPIRLPTEHLTMIDIGDYKPQDGSVLDLSQCGSLVSVVYRKSTAIIKLPSKPVDELRNDGLTRKLILKGP